MVSSGDVSDDMCALRECFQRACQTSIGEGGASGCAERLAETATRVAKSRDEKDCEALLSFVISCFDTSEGLSLMDTILFEVFNPLLDCSHVSERSCEIFRSFLEIITAKCTPREVIVLLLAALDDRAG